MILREAVENYLEECKTRQPQTLTWYQQKLSVFVAWCEDQGIDLDKINNRTVVQFADHVSTRTSKKHTPISGYTIRGYVQVVKSFANWCLGDDEYDEVVSAKAVSRIQMPTVDSTIIKTFTPDHISRLYEACTHEYNTYLVDRDTTILSVLLGTGIRSGELCGLTIGNVVLKPEDAHITVYGKRKKWREIGLPTETRRRLQRYLRTHRSHAGPTDLVFLTRSDGPMTPGGMCQLFDRLNEWAGGIEGVRCSPHTCRHTFAMQYMRTIGDIYSLCILMGHTSVKVTEVYLKSAQTHEARKKQTNR
jgi:site-specific recombinase XerD